MAATSISGRRIAAPSAGHAVHGALGLDDENIQEDRSPQPGSNQPSFKSKFLRGAASPGHLKGQGQHQASWQQQHTWMPSSEHLEAADPLRLQRNISPAASAEDEGYTSANSWGHSAFNVPPTAKYIEMRQAMPRSSQHAPEYARDAGNFTSSPAHDTQEKETPRTENNRRHGDASTSGSGHTAVDGTTHLAMPTRPAPLPAPDVPDQLPHQLQADLCSSSVNAAAGEMSNSESAVATATADEDERPLGEIQKQMSSEPSYKDIPIPAIPVTVVVPRRTRAKKQRSPVLSYAEGEEEEERLYAMTEQPADIKRMPSLGPKVKKNAPAPWEVEGAEEEFLNPPSSRAQREWWGRKSTEVRDQGRLSIESSRNVDATSATPLEDALGSDSASIAASAGSFFAATRARSKSVSSSAASVLKGLGLSAPPMSGKKKHPLKLVKPLSREDGRKPRMQLAAGISSEDYQNLPADWSPPPSAPALLSAPRNSISPMTESFVHLQTANTCGYPLRSSSRTEPMPPLPTDAYRMRQSSSNESNNLSTTSPTDASQHSSTTAATSPATPSFVEAQSISKDSTTSHANQSDLVDTSAGEAEMLNELQSAQAPSNSNSTPYKLISLEQARINQVRERELARQRISALNAASIGADETPRTTSDGFSSSISMTSFGSASQAAETRSLRNKKSGFLRMFNKEKPPEHAPMMPSSPGSRPETASTVLADELPPRPLLEAPRSRIQTEERPAMQASGLTAPALSLRPMSSMFSGFQPEMLDAGVASGTGGASKRSASAISALSDVAEPSPTTSMLGSSGANSLSSRRRARAPADIITAPYVGPAAAGPKSSGSLQARSAPPRRSSVDTSESNGQYFSPVTSPSAVKVESMEAARPTSIHSHVSDDPTRASLPSPAWRNRIMEIEQKMAELASELSEIRQTQASQLGPPLPDEALASPVSLGGRSPNLPSVSPIPPCSSCGCSCAEKRRQQALNEAALLKGSSVLDRGRAIKPLGEGNTSKFGGHWDRQ
ncbi:hypothetical protein K437DRAFT_292279 [Tilletiaria anomala UBC 951]|uniref:Uncharacterized protein n=1 Tax=Tilletiaria anomala (strain ATCC 24038 / CBS 436.72 / UBC 951) TaxID=1037660 RepID=A0A066WHS4_TILAU|nr:uncharacterized protein K437DRAFT_292279 [Tilletiaria anomala UBC 951]KDN53331.1 hypothetical protein K437DRAFT_292279 [Tilletiaria anomala UBC 951]